MSILASDVSDFYSASAAALAALLAADSTPVWVDGVPVGIIDGNNRVFTLPRALAPGGAVRLFLRDLQRSAAEYSATTAGGVTTITYLGPVVPVPPDRHRVLMQVPFA